MLSRPTIMPTTESLLARYCAELTRITDRGQAGLALGRAARLAWLDALMRNIVAQNFDAIISFDEGARVTTANAAANAMFGYRSKDLIGRHALDLFPDLHCFRRRGAKGVAAAGDRVEGGAQRADGSPFPVELSLRPTVVDRERIVVAIVRDITKSKAQEQQLRHQAAHDALTDLPNRVLLQAKLTEALQASEREQQPLALLLLDLDRFKEINDTLGHHVGDLLLILLAKRLRACVRTGDTIARLGGDEFAILLPPPSELSQALSIAERAIEATRHPFEVLNGLRLEVGISIGIALAPQHAADQTRLLQCADVAMYAAKRGTRSLEVYDRDQDQNTIRHLTLTGALRQAIEGGELSFAYQPKLDLADGTIVSVEALARWQHPIQGTVMPDEFIPHAERTGLIRPFTRWSLESVLAQMAAWQADGMHLGVALNLSARSLHEKDLPELVGSLLEQTRVDPALLTLELTESAVMLDPDGAKTTLHRLHDLGVQLSIDDFGTGYSSLSHLQRLPLDELKIDQSFVAHMTENQHDLVIVRSTIDLAHNLGLSVVAEGMEAEDHLIVLRRLGCDLAQGFLVAPPLDAVGLQAWFEAAPWAVRGPAGSSLAPQRLARSAGAEAPVPA